MVDNINVLFVGKTGVGKSSLLNYIVGRKAADVGDGKPCTGYGIHQHDKIPLSDNLTMTVCDSWGLEANKTDDWIKLIEKDVSKRNRDGIDEIFHCAIYCVKASGARIEDFERDVIIPKLCSLGLFPILVMTSCDDAASTEKERNAVREILEEKFLDSPIVCVCSVSGEMTFGDKFEPFGKEELFKAIINNMRQSICHYGVVKYKKITKEYLSLAWYSLNSKIDDDLGWKMLTSPDNVTKFCQKYNNIKDAEIHKSHKAGKTELNKVLSDGKGLIAHAMEFFGEDEKIYNEIGNSITITNICDDSWFDTAMEIASGPWKWIYNAIKNSELTEKLRKNISDDIFEEMVQLDDIKKLSDINEVLRKGKAASPSVQTLRDIRHILSRFFEADDNGVFYNQNLADDDFDETKFSALKRMLNENGYSFSLESYNSYIEDERRIFGGALLENRYLISPMLIYNSVVYYRAKA